MAWKPPRLVAARTATRPQARRRRGPCPGAGRRHRRLPGVREGRRRRRKGIWSEIGRRKRRGRWWRRWRRRTRSGCPQHRPCQHAHPQAAPPAHLCPLHLHRQCAHGWRGRRRGGGRLRRLRGHAPAVCRHSTPPQRPSSRAATRERRVEAAAVAAA
eukprot:3275933-Prymnesium_polylepis.1